MHICQVRVSDSATALARLDGGRGLQNDLHLWRGAWSREHPVAHDASHEEADVQVSQPFTRSFDQRAPRAGVVETARPPVTCELRWFSCCWRSSQPSARTKAHGADIYLYLFCICELSHGHDSWTSITRNLPAARSATTSSVRPNARRLRWPQGGRMRRPGGRRARNTKRACVAQHDHRGDQHAHDSS